MFSSLGWLYGKRRTRLGINQLEGLAKVYRFNLSNVAERFQTQSETSPEIMKNISKTVFNELEENLTKNLENIDLLNPAEHLYTDESDLELNISNIFNFRSSIFHSNEIDFNEIGESDDASSDESGEDNEYDVDEIIANI